MQEEFEMSMMEELNFFLGDEFIFMSSFNV